MDTASRGPSIFASGKAELSTHASVRSAFVMHQMFTIIFASLSAFLTWLMHKTVDGTTSKPRGGFRSN
jgi:hypothetical protein